MSAVIITNPIELVGGRHDGTQLTTEAAKDRIKYKGIFYSDTNQITADGRLIFRCSSQEGRLKQSFFERDYLA